MSTGQIWRTAADSLENSLSFGAQLGARLRGSEIIELISDLGGGKTTFVKGIVRGMGSHETVRSPSFTIGNQYTAENGMALYHFDFYRLHEPGILREQLSELSGDAKAVIVIEWAEIVEDALPADRVTITIKVTGEQSREYIVSSPPSLSYLIPKENN